MDSFVYKIRCNGEDCNYVGETGHKLQTRLQEHKAAARRHDSISQLATHIGETGHNFDIQEATTVGRGTPKGERLMLESWNAEANSVNRHLDLPAAYRVLRHYIIKGGDLVKPSKALQTKTAPYRNHRKREQAYSILYRGDGTQH
ncbi:unnamed protein product [Dibothriocephalus latus]|uniref:GIY-YIG domain-containing protein n=1 Tax=Dibothriocephalus latus TaxID=60516 RepID=A0A3P6SE55_DIBLA|nr:unnamed protein product [Dibothriocephalus latus]